MVPHFSSSAYNPIDFPFQFNFKLSDPRKERIILVRNYLGKIIHSKVWEWLESGNLSR